MGATFRIVALLNDSSHGRGSKRSSERNLVGRLGLDRGESQPLVTGAAGWMVGGGVRAPAGSDTTRRAKGFINPRSPDKEPVCKSINYIHLQHNTKLDHENLRDSQSFQDAPECWRWLSKVRFC